MATSMRILKELVLSDGTPITKATPEQLRAEAARERALARAVAEEHLDRADNLLNAAKNREKAKR